jgi:hypothetical protein
MLKPKKNYEKWIIISLIIFVTILTNIRMSSDAATIQYTQEQYDKLIRFGITAPLGVVGYDLSEIHALSYLDWAKESTSIPDGIEYIHVIRVSDSAYANGELLNSISPIILANLGDVWIIGNEPDRFCFQDSVNPELYAQRYFKIANKIRSLDPSAKLVFGSIVQPTPIRIRYLERAIDELILLSDNDKQQAMGLIDIWSTHAFILNEQPYQWGADIPVGFFTYDEEFLTNLGQGYCFTGETYEKSISDAIKIFDYADTYSINIFQGRIINFRQWLNSIGERNKPLWITEFGSLLPDWQIRCKYEPYPDCSNPINGWPTQEDNIEYMINTFDFLLQSSTSLIGMPDDGNKLVQRWYWYSLNDHLYSFGGSLFDPDNNKEITNQGIAYKNYIELLIGPKIFLPLVRK